MDNELISAIRLLVALFAAGPQELLDRNKDLVVRNEELQAKVSSQHQKLNRLTKQLDRLNESEIGVLNNTIKRMKIELDCASKKPRLLQDKITKLKQQNTESLSRLAARLHSANDKIERLRIIGNKMQDLSFIDTKIGSICKILESGFNQNNRETIFAALEELRDASSQLKKIIV